MFAPESSSRNGTLAKNRYSSLLPMKRKAKSNTTKMCKIALYCANSNCNRFSQGHLIQKHRMEGAKNYIGLRSILALFPHENAIIIHGTLYSPITHRIASSGGISSVCTVITSSNLTQPQSGRCLENSRIPKFSIL